MENSLSNRALNDTFMTLNRVSDNPTMVGALAGSLLCRKAAANAFTQHKRSTVTSNIIESLGHRLESFHSTTSSSRHLYGYLAPDKINLGSNPLSEASLLDLCTG